MADGQGPTYADGGAVHVPSSDPTTPVQCPDCPCPPHRNMARPNGNKVCPRCGCPDLIAAKRERDAELSLMKSDHVRNTDPGFR